mgnify:CR=1 FL=1
MNKTSTDDIALLISVPFRLWFWVLVMWSLMHYVGCLPAW